MRVQHALPSETPSRALSFRSVKCFYHALRCPTFVNFLRFCLAMAGAISKGRLAAIVAKEVSVGEYACSTFDHMYHMCYIVYYESNNYW